MSSFKMSTLSDHAFPMRLHLHPKLHNSICAYPHWVWVEGSARSGQSCCAFLHTQVFKSNGVELRHSTEHGGNTGFCCGSGKDAITDDCLCGPPDCPGLGLAQRAFQYPCMRPVGSFCTHGSFLGEKSRNEVHSLPTGCR